MNKLKAIILLLILSFIFVNPISAQEDPSPSPTGSVVRDKVQEKVNQVLNNPFAYIGTVTDISGDNIQISKFSLDNSTVNSSSEIQQITAGDETVYVSIGKTTKTITFDDVAIGDFVVAMGYKSGNGVLETKRILTVEAITPSTRESGIYKVREIEGSEISVNKNGDSDVYTITTKNATIYEDVDGEMVDLSIKELNTEDKIIIAGTLDGNDLEARTIRVIKRAPETESEIIEE